MRPVFKDSSGKDSSKRVLGTAALVVGLVMALGVTVAYVWLSIKGVELDVSSLSGIFAYVFGAGTALLGTGVLEHGKSKSAHIVSGSHQEHNSPKKRDKQPSQ